MLSDQERFVITAMTQTLMFDEKKYDQFFDFVFQKTGIRVTSIEDLADQDIWDSLQPKCRAAFEKLIKTQ